MRVLHGARDLGHQRDDPTGFVAKTTRDVQQTSAGGKFHAEEGQAVVAFAHFVDRQDVRMIQARGSFRFATKPNECFLRLGLVTQDPLSARRFAANGVGARGK